MASSIETFLHNVRAKTLTAAGGNVHDLLDFLPKCNSMLTENCALLDTALDGLNVHAHTLAYMHILMLKLTHSPKLTDNLQKLLEEFIDQCDASIVRKSLLTYSEMCHQYVKLVVKNKNLSYIKEMKVIRHALEKIRVSQSHLTPIHADLCQLCLNSKLFKPALGYLDIDITDIMTADDPQHDCRYFLLYYYYGGMIYTAMKNYERALYFYEVAATAPALAMSHIMLESYKKYILLSLIMHGKIMPLPKYASQIINRFMKPLSHAYHDLNRIYLAGNSEDVRNHMFKHRDTFQRDVNLGLVKQVANSLYKKNIQRLTKTFLTLSLADVAFRAQLSGPAEAEKYILKMIKSGEIFASINQKDGMVIFKEDPQLYNSPEMFDKIQSHITTVVGLNNKILKMEVDILLNPLYVKKSMGHAHDDEVSTKSSFMGEPEE